MRQQKKRLREIAMVFVLVVAVAVMGSVQITAHAASKKATNKKALAAYEKLLSKSTYKWSSMDMENQTSEYQFCVVDANKDGVKDLLLMNYSACHASGYCKLLTYYKGKVKCVLTADGISVYEKAGVVNSYYTGTGTHLGHYYKIKNGKAVEKASFAATDTKEYARPKVKHTSGGTYKLYYYSFKINGKEVSYKTYKKKMKKLLKNSEASELTFYDNTAANRAMYIK